MTTHFFGDTAVLLGRSLKHVTRNVVTIITTAIIPVATIRCSSTGSAARLHRVGFIRGLPAARHPADHDCVGRLLHRNTDSSGDMQSGIFERFQSLPIARSGVLWAHVLTLLIACFVSLVLVVLVALLMGFRSPAGVPAWLAVGDIYSCSPWR